MTRLPRKPTPTSFGRRCRIGALLAVLAGTVAGCVSAEPMYETPLSAEALAPPPPLSYDSARDPTRTDRVWRLRLNHL